MFWPALFISTIELTCSSIFLVSVRFCLSCSCSLSYLAHYPVYFSYIVWLISGAVLSILPSLKQFSSCLCLRAPFRTVLLCLDAVHRCRPKLGFAFGRAKGCGGSLGAVASFSPVLSRHWPGKVWERAKGRTRVLEAKPSKPSLIVSRGLRVWLEQPRRPPGLRRQAGVQRTTLRHVSCLRSP